MMCVRKALLSSIIMFAAGFAAIARADEAPQVVVDIAPVHSLVAQVMKGVTEPALLLGAAASPHDFALRPSQARDLNDADIVVWTGPNLMPWMDETLGKLAPEAENIAFSRLAGVQLLAFRSGAAFEDHDHAHEHADTHEEEAEGMDPHLWLDPRNAAVLVRHLAESLSESDPGRADLYRSNAREALLRLTALEGEIKQAVAPLRSQSYLVFHDAYHYFEARFDVPAAGAVALSEGTRPGARRVLEIRNMIKDRGIACIFAEPQFEPKLLDKLADGSEVRIGTLDPLGASIEPGPGHYGQLLRGMADSLSGCLAP